MLLSSSSLGSDSPLSGHSFYCSVISGVKRWSHVSFVVMNRSKNSIFCSETSPNIWVKSPHEAVSIPLWANVAPILCTAFLYSNFQSLDDVQQFLKCLPYLISRVLLVEYHFVDFLHHFWRCHLIWSTNVMFVLAGHTTSFKLNNLLLLCCKWSHRFL